MPHHPNAYDQALLQIQKQALSLGQMVRTQLQRAMRSLIEQDRDLAEAVIAADDAVDDLDAVLELAALEIISIQQPLEHELRFLAAAMRISRELERIADYSCDIAESALQLTRRGEGFTPLAALPRMAGLVQAMLERSLEAYRDRDLEAALRLDDDDDEADRSYAAFYQELSGHLQANPDRVDQAFNTLLIARYLERIGDHAVNIAEMLIFSETGERHPFKRKTEP